MGAVAQAKRSLPVTIRQVEVIPVRIPFNSSFTIATSHSPTRESVDVLIVRVHSSEGVVGVGETQAWRRQGSSEVLENLAHLVTSLFEPALVGRSPFDVASIMSDLNAIAYNSLYAQAAVGDALYDLMGKLLDKPVHELIGGRSRDRIPVGFVASIMSSRDAMIDQIQAAYEKGYRHIRVKIGLDAEHDLENIRHLREHFGNKIVLRADANGGMSYETALPLLRKLEKYALEYVEQPVPGWDLEGMADLARNTGVVLSADESLTTDHSLIEIIRRRAAAMIQTKTGKNGGIHYTRQLWTIAHAGGIGIFPGNHPGTSIHTLSVAHLCAAWPHPLITGDFQQFSVEEITQDVVKYPVKVKDGYIEVPMAPGLGLELDEDRLRHLRIDN